MGDPFLVGGLPAQTAEEAFSGFGTALGGRLAALADHLRAVADA